MSSRRDFLRTVVLGTGSVYMSSLLGCSDSKVRNLGRMHELKNLEQPYVHTRSQQYTNAHAYIRDHKALPSSHPEEVQTDVAIIGAGIAGLTCAYALSKLGYSVVLVENETRTGGAAVYSSFRGLHFPLASIYFVDNNPLIQELCRYADVKPLSAPEDALVLNKTTYYDYWQDSVIASLPISTSDKQAMRRFRDDMLAIEEPPAYPLPDKLSPELARYDSMSARQFCASYGSNFLSQFINLYTRSSMGGSLDDTNTYALLNFYTGEIAKNPQTTRFTFEGGLGGFVSKLGAKLGQVHTILETCAVRITNNAQSVDVDCISKDGRATKLKAKQTILATQKFQAPFLLPDLPEAQSAAMRQLQYAPMLTVHVCSDTPILEGRGFDTWYPEAGELFTDIIDPRSIKVPPDSGAYVASVYCPLPSRQRSLLSDEAQVVQRARQVAEKVLALHGNTQVETVQDIYTYAWGHSMALAKPGSHNGIAQMARRSFKRTHFANTDNDSCSAFENAIANAFTVAEKVERLLKTGS